MCEYSAKRSDQLSIHKKSIHFHEKYPCEICDFQASSKAYLNQHVQRIHQVIGKKKLDCTLCSHQTIYRSNLMTHTKRVHLKLKPKD